MSSMSPVRYGLTNKEWTLRPETRWPELLEVELAVKSRGLNASFLRASSGVAIRASSVAALVKPNRTTTFNIISWAAASQISVELRQLQ